jgi:hypothetical protein
MRIAKATIVMLGLLASWATSALTFTVNSVADVAASGDLANGVCETAPGNGVCTLHAALQKGNAYPGGGAVINVPAGSYVRGSPYPAITAALTLQGAGLVSTIVDAAGLDRGFTVAPGAVVAISGFTIRNAAPPFPTQVGAGVRNVGTLTLADSLVVDGADGGVSNGGTMTLRNSSVLRNRTANFGGGVFNDISATLTIVNSVIAYNSSDQGGGGIVAEGSSKTTLVNSTISNNYAGASGGGGILLPIGSQVLEIYNSTVAGNVMVPGPAVGIYGGGLQNNGSGIVRVQNSLFAYNYVLSSAGDCAGAVVSLDYNVFQTTILCEITGATSHNQVGGDPMLDALRLNGGPTLTRALLAASAAIDAIPAARCTDQFGALLMTDQRGFARNGAFCDIGAFEGALPTPIFDANLIRNGDAEQGTGAPTGATVGIPNWTVRAGAVTVVPYNAPGGFPVVGKDVVQGAHGSNFFAGGPSTDNGIATQIIDLAAASAAIDGNGVAFAVSGDFGGFADDHDTAYLEVRFQDAAHNPIGETATIGDYPLNDHGKTGLWGTYSVGGVPAGARYAVVTLNMIHQNGDYNDGYADNLRLVLLAGGQGPDLNQHGLTGSWYEPATAGQGFEVEVFPDFPNAGTGLAQVSWFTFDALAGGAERQRWYTFSGSPQSAFLTIYENTGGNFDAPPITTGKPVGAAFPTFDSCTSGILVYFFSDDSGRAGVIPLTRLTPNVTCSMTAARPTNADFALSGNWFDPATSGQGLTVEVNPNAGVLFAAWYTYTPSSGGVSQQRWFTAQGAFAAGARSIPVQLYETTGGLFDAQTFPAPNTVVVGSGTLSFASCSSAKLDFNFTGGTSAGKSGSIALVRVGPVPPGCV